MAPPPHPLQDLTESEILHARGVIIDLVGSSEVIFFRSIQLCEPLKEDLLPFLQDEHDGSLSTDSKRPPRLALVEYDTVKPGEVNYTKATVDVEKKSVVTNNVLKPAGQSPFSMAELEALQDICMSSQMFKDAMSEFTLPEGFDVTVDPWPYGGPDESETLSRTMQGLVFAVDKTLDNKDANHYAYPIPLIPVVNYDTKEMIRVDRLATGGADDGLSPAPRSSKPKTLFTSKRNADYVPELIDRPLRSYLKPLNIVQPEGASFSAHSDGLIEWQKWRFRLTFTPREGAVLHDICYDNRPVLYRLSFSEMTVPYGDPRPPFHRKQAFDLGDVGVGRSANNLELGCDCLGAIHYYDTLMVGSDGKPKPAKSVVCLHEQDNGVLWKHTNFRTSRAAVTRNREFVVQFIVTLANYEYIFAFKFDLAGAIAIETRATGILSVVAIDDGKKSDYGNVVGPGILAQNHQHIFALRIDPCIDSYSKEDTEVVVEESHGRKIDPKTNPFGNFYEIQRQPVERATWIDAEPRLNRILRLENRTKTNIVSGKRTGYKLVAPVTQLMLADEESTVAKRARFAQHNHWVTGYRDGELFAAGEFTNQSREEDGGVGDMVKRGDWFTGEKEGSNSEGSGKRSSPVIWTVFGLTHNPRVEDWPVMPVEIYQVHLKPADFFTSNPALDVPSSRNKSSVLVPCCDQKSTMSKGNDIPLDQPLQHLQGGAHDVPAAEAGAHVNGHA
ncbi:copper amine oxidase, enzyme domain-containing protein [Sarocladium implicatum]|nr:copper amine oxidase, enzyme domain-containing protein [Sarocladium implicatum]